MRFLIHHFFALFLAVVALTSLAEAQAPAQLTFATPEEAAAALLQALKGNDVDKLLAVFGPGGQDLATGDPVADRQDREVVALALQQSSRWVSRGSKKKELIIGYEAWPFPVPLAKKGNGWQFDTEAGKEEVIARRIGANELAVIQLCGTYVSVQQTYAGRVHDSKPAGIFAQKFQSTPGRQDGLYWKTKPGETPSPLGDLAAGAAAEGYEREKNPTAPFHGYYFRILTAQGSAVPGGAKSYVVNGDMSGGFALIAFPANYDHSGVMTFIVNQSGVVYEKDLGLETAKLAGSVTEYNPDKTWKRARLP